MNWQRLTRGRGPGPVADLLHVARPCDGEALLPPYTLEKSAIGPLRGAIDRAGDIGQAHFHRVGRRALRLLGGRVAQPASCRTHVPEIAADEVALPGIVMQHGREWRIGVRLRLAIAESRAH